jgi:hypothetical protein
MSEATPHQTLAQNPGVASTVTRHAAGLLLASLLAALLVFPQWYILLTDPPEGVRSELTPWGAEDQGIDLAYYSTSIRRAYDLEFPARVNFGFSDDDTPLQTGAWWLEGIGLLGRVTGGVFPALAIVMTLVAIALFVAFYALAFQLTGSRIAGACMMPLALAAVYVLSQADGILPLRRWHVLEEVLRADPGLSFHPWLRIIPPLMPLAPFFLAVLAVPRAVETGRRAWVVAAAAGVALVVYSYLYFWAALAVALAAWGAWLLIRGDRASATRLAVIGAIAAALSLPELAAAAYNAFTLGDDARARLGAGLDPAFIPSVRELAVRLALGLPFLAALLRGPEHNRLYIALYLAPLLLVKLPHGAPQPFHYSDQAWPAFAIPAVVAGSAELWRLLPSSNSQRVALAGLGFAAVLAGAHFATLQVRAMRDLDAAFSLRADEHAAFTWMDDNFDHNDTVVTPSFSTNMYLGVLTPAQRYVREAFVPEPGDDEVVERYLRASAALGIEPDAVFERLEPERFIFEDPSTDLEEREAQLEESMAFYLLNWQVTVPERIELRLDGWRESYTNLLRATDVLSAYDAGYIYCGPRERLWPIAAVAPDTHVRVAFEQGEVAIYELVERSDDGATVFTGCG